MGDSGNTKALLKAFGLAPSKQRGQNFLIHRATAEAIVEAAAFYPGDRVIEVGVGLGALTLPLSRRVAHVTGIEVDRGIIGYHEQQNILPGNVTLLHGDILNIDFGELADAAQHPLKIIANLPYSISHPFIMTIVENRSWIGEVVVMLQQEVADRLVAHPGTKTYGIPTVLLGSCARVDKLLTLAPDEFHPRPKIHSQVIRIEIRTGQPDGCSFDLLRRVVRSAFAARRKTLLNNLLAMTVNKRMPAAAREETRNRLVARIASAGLSPSIRAEDIDIAQFIRLASELETIPGCV